MAIDVEKKAAIRRMFYVDHHKIEEIAKHFGVHHATVSRALNQDYPRARIVDKRPKIVDPHMPYIKAQIERYPRIKAKKIYIDLKAKGFKGSYNSIRRAVREIRPQLSRLTVLLKVLPGEEAQVDWAHLGTIQVGNAIRKVYCFAMTLSWSRASWAELTYDMTTETLLRCHTRAFEYFGGIPRTILYDNMKSVVIERVGDSIRFNDVFMEYASWYCFEPRVCDPYQPQQKGRVERFFRTMRGGFLDGYLLQDFEAAQYQLRLWLFEANKRPWPDDKQFTVSERLLHERGRLLPLPEALLVKNQKVVKAGRVPVIRFYLNSYSIDPRFINQSLTVLYDENLVQIFSGDEPAATHRRCFDREQFIEDPAHRAATFASLKSGQQSAYMRNKLVEQFPALEKVLEWAQEHGHSLQSTLRQIAQLRQTYTDRNLDKAISEACAAKRPTPEAIAVRCRQYENRKERGVALTLPDRPEITSMETHSHDLANYDNL